MTSKNLYWAKWKENTKRRAWTFVLCFGVLFLLYPVFNIIFLSGAKGEIAKMTADGATAMQLALQQGYTKNEFASNIGFSPLFVLAAALFAILFSVQGFSFLYSRRKMDFYMSVPVSGPKRFLMIWANGILVFGAACLVNLALCWGLGAAYGVLDAAMLAHSILAFAVNMLAYTAIYQVALLAVMLTGNVLTALLGCTVLFAYEYALRFIYSQLKSTFFYSYCMADYSLLWQRPWISPFTGFLLFTENAWYKEGKLYGMGGVPGWGAPLMEEIGFLALVAAVTGLAVFYLFRKRKTESYHQAIAFPKIKPVLEFLLLVPFSLTVGMLVSRTADDRNFFLFAGTLLGALAGHWIIQLIYERELKALLGKKTLAAVCMAVSVLILCLFRFDLIGFDRFLPQKEQVAAVSVSLENDYSNFGRYAVPFFSGYGKPTVEDLLEKMNSTDENTIAAVLSLARKWQEAGLPTADREREIAADVKQTMDMDHSRVWVARYTLDSGRKVYRRFYSMEDTGAEELETIMQDPAYKRIRYQLYEEAFLEALSQMKITWYDGLQEIFYTGDKEKLLEAFRQDFESYGYDLISENLPWGGLKFELSRSKEGDLLKWNYPVYGSFTNTLAMLAENEIEVREPGRLLSSEDVAAVTVRYYYYEDGRQDGLFAPGEIKEQMIQCTFEDKEEIRQLLAAVYPESLTDVAGEEVRYVKRNTRIGVSLTLTSEALKKRYLVPDVFFQKGKEPDFLEKRIKEAAVYG